MIVSIFFVVMVLVIECGGGGVIIMAAVVVVVMKIGPIIKEETPMHGLLVYSPSTAPA